MGEYVIGRLRLFLDVVFFDNTFRSTCRRDPASSSHALATFPFNATPSPLQLFSLLRWRRLKDRPSFASPSR